MVEEKKPFIEALIHGGDVVWVTYVDGQRRQCTERGKFLYIVGDAAVFVSQREGRPIVLHFRRILRIEPPHRGVRGEA
ncbi:hypothetical protein [Calditerricola satsumensis]|uniref:Uncharacterized protein n=1 Tax=Calditerricola satsumensis TaxID=373054 RepID=A0A8J3FCE8_9BACI|nr:hypothetical protein [Calditerricola satsumensis]GGK05873.1 hypothetical protein GCM10007043_19860 [Calditerricola satsumensis]